MKESLNYNSLDADQVQCRACSHFCKIGPEKTGVCGVRQNLEGKLYLLPYGYAVALNMDPIEKKPLYHFLPGTYTYSFGTLGCNFRCSNCQNYEISQMFGLKGKAEEYGKMEWGYGILPRDMVEGAMRNNCPSISYTYNEPTVFLEYALDTMKIAQENGLKNVWVSNGFMSEEILDLITPYLDAVNIDLKSFEDEFYVKNCGARLEPVLENCKKLAQSGVWMEVTTLIIPTLSDEPEMLKKIAGFIKEELGEEVPWHVSAFSGAMSWKLQHLPSTPAGKVREAEKIGKEAGLKNVYAGNI